MYIEGERTKLERKKKERRRKKIGGRNRGKIKKKKVRRQTIDISLWGISLFKLNSIPIASTVTQNEGINRISTVPFPGTAQSRIALDLELGYRTLSTTAGPTLSSSSSTPVGASTDDDNDDDRDGCGRLTHDVPGSRSISLAICSKYPIFLARWPRSTLLRRRSGCARFLQG